MIFGLNGGFFMGNAQFSLKWGISEVKTRDFRVKWGILKEKMRDFRVKWGILEEKTRDFRCNGGFSKRKRVIFFRKVFFGG